MPRYEDKTAEQIWQTIEALKRSPETAAQNSAKGTPTSDSEHDDLLPLAETLATIFQEESQATSGQTNARLRLQEAIRTDLASRPAPKTAPPWAARFPWSRRVAMMALVILVAVVVMAAAFWLAISAPPNGLFRGSSAPVEPAPPCAPPLRRPLPLKASGSSSSKQNPNTPAKLPVNLCP
ncbi:MAG TPA: hypothetical protein VKU00_03525 [Chthonomonadaceae bacterium]|nr:hypothetical protein [Chthonomonadaceae bacterium]